MSWEGLNSTDLARIHCGSNSSFSNLYSAEEIKILLAAAEVGVEGGMLSADLLRSVMFVLL